MLKLGFYGGARSVTGANYLLEISDKGKTTRILIDCGLHQGSRYCEKHNFEPFTYDPKTIDAVLITHAHIDHTGRLPQLVKSGFHGKIFSTPPTKDFAEPLLIDSGGLMAKEAEERKMPLLYDSNDVKQTMKLWDTIGYRQKFKIGPPNGGFEIEFFNAGHILGSAIIKVSIADKKIIFSGDLGNIAAPLINDTDPIPEADYAIIESAYGNRIHKTLLNRKDRLEDAIEDTIKTGGALMIPAFAMERTQELLFEINELIENGRVPKAPIFVDSPLAIKITEIYKKYFRDPAYADEETLALLKKGDKIFNFPGLKFTTTTEESKMINEIPMPKIIIAGSGMSQGGRILHHERRYLSDPKSAILFIGYQVNGSLGRRILEGEKMVKIFGEEIPVRCKTAVIDGYSAHADAEKLTNWLKPMRLKLKKVFVVQGEEDQALGLARKIQDELAIEAEAPLAGETILL